MGQNTVLHCKEPMNGLQNVSPCLSAAQHDVVVVVVVVEIVQ